MDAGLMLNKAMNAALVLGFFAGILVFLRFLYGPGGKFRDPQWDRWNEEARLAGELERQDRDIEDYRKVFEAYASGFFGGDAGRDGLIRLKIDHSLRVLAIARELAAREEALAGPQRRRALLLAALFHDVGRFEQVRRYGTFADALSCNHGTLGARVLREQGFLEAEAPAMRRLVITAVAAHNRLSLPDALGGDLRPVLEALRDADKLDIMRSLIEAFEPGKSPDEAVALHLSDEPEAFSPIVLEALEAGRTGRYRDMRCINDFRLVLCSWFFDLHFGTSLAVARREALAARLLGGLEGAPEAEARARAALSRLPVFA